MLIQTNLIPKQFDALTIGWIILIRPHCIDDACLIAHEKVHVKQFWRTWGLFPLLYPIWEYRIEFESEAFAEQVKCGASLDWAAEKLARDYDLDISVEQAKRIIYERITNRL